MKPFKILTVLAVMLTMMSMTTIDENPIKESISISESSNALFSFQLLETNNDNWDQKQFLAIDPLTVDPDEPYDLAISDVINNNSDAENIDVLIRFDEILPGSPQGGTSLSYFITVLLEEEVAPGFWNAIADSSQRRIGDFVNQPKEVEFIAQKTSLADQGQPFDTQGGVRWFVNKAPSEKLRVRVIVHEWNPNGASAFVSAKITGAYRLY